MKFTRRNQNCSCRPPSPLFPHILIMATLSRSAHDEEYTKVAPPPPHPLKGRAIIVTGEHSHLTCWALLTTWWTGAASGIGRATALYLASLGVRLALTDSDSEGGRAVCNDVRALGDSVDVVFATMDVAGESSATSWSH